MAESAGRWRVVAWTVAALMLLAPLVAMQITDEVRWSASDFAVFGLMLLVAGGTFELAVRMGGSLAYRAAVGVALAAAFLLIWMNLAVGIIGTEDDPANLLFGGVLAVGIAGTAMTRFRPDGMAGALLATACAQMLVAAITLLAGLGSTAPARPAQLWGLTAIFTGLWLASAWLFRQAARRQVPPHNGVIGGSTVYSVPFSGALTRRVQSGLSKLSPMKRIT